jgi:hypothetical protein
MKLLAVLATACLALADAAGVLPQPRPPAFTLAVLRQDGIAIPFASFTGRAWERRWPVRLPLEVPISLGAVPERWWAPGPAPERMAHWAAGERKGEVALTDLALRPLMCDLRLVLSTDYKSGEPAPPPVEGPYPKDGLLVSADVAVERIPPLPMDSGFGAKLPALVAEEFNRRETQAATQFSDWRHPFSREQRRTIPIVVEAAYATPMDREGWTAYFIEAVRQYPAGRGDRSGCGPATFASGWLMYGPRNEVRVRLRAGVTYCDRKGVGYMLPLGRMVLGGRSYWIAQFAGFEGEFYEVIHPTPGGAELEVSYHVGSCPG